MGDVKGTMWDEKCTLGPGGEGPQIPWERGPVLRSSSWEPVGFCEIMLLGSLPACITLTIWQVVDKEINLFWPQLPCLVNETVMAPASYGRAQRNTHGHWELRELVTKGGR